MATREKTNQCTPEGLCTAGMDEGKCKYCVPSALTAFCVYRAWFMDKCLSPFALTAAREKAAA